MTDVSLAAGPDGPAQHVALVEIHRPPANYFDEQLISDLASALDEASADKRNRVVVLCSEGKHFCAGADFAGASAHSLGSIASLYDQARRLFATELPIVAAVQGSAVGGGLGLALACDFRVASPSTRFSANFARIGLHHGFAISVTLPRVVGEQAALEMLFSGRRVQGEEAKTLGLCDRLVPDDLVRQAAIELATELSGSAPLAIRAIRRTMRRDLVEAADRAFDAERTEQETLLATADFAEGVRANAERRPPEFTAT